MQFSSHELCITELSSVILCVLVIGAHVVAVKAMPTQRVGLLSQDGANKIFTAWRALT